MNSLYRKLAKSGITRYKNLYIPYILNSIFLLVILIIMQGLLDEKMLDSEFGFSTIKIVINLGRYIIMIFSFIIMYYTYNYIELRKYKEIATYEIMGLEKKHIYKIKFWEMLYLSSLIIIPGFVIGNLLYKIIFALYIKLIGLHIDVFGSGIFINLQSSFNIAIIFLLVISLVIIFSAMRLNNLSIATIRQKARESERKAQKTRIRGIVGFMFIIIGYFLSLNSVLNPDILIVFFVAVIFVIIGTFLSFTFIVSTLLNIIKSNKSKYYKKENFSAVSGLFHRVNSSSSMLSGITILSTSIIIILISGISLFTSIRQSVFAKMPTDYSVSTFYIKDYEVLKEEIENFLDKKELRYKLQPRFSEDLTFIKTDNGLKIVEDNSNIMDFNKLFNVYLTYLPDSNIGSDLYQVDNNNDDKDVIFSDMDYKLEKIDRRKIPITLGNSGLPFVDSIYLVTGNLDLYNKFRSDYYSKNKSYEEALEFSKDKSNIVIGIDKLDDNPKWNAYFNELEDYLEKKFNLSEKDMDIVFSNRELDIKRDYTFYGSIFFVGVFLIITFIISESMIMYYKQLSEAIADRKRFETMNRLGMSKEEAKFTVNRQVNLVFMIPLAFAFTHVLFAMPILKHFLTLLGLYSDRILQITIIFSIMAFTIFYIIIYKLTQKVYTNIVLDKEN